MVFVSTNKRTRPIRSTHAIIAEQFRPRINNQSEKHIKFLVCIFLCSIHKQIVFGCVLVRCVWVLIAEKFRYIVCFLLDYSLALRIDTENKKIEKRKIYISKTTILPIKFLETLTSEANKRKADTRCILILCVGNNNY